MTERLPPVPGPLTPEERSLAARLARLGPHGEPSPALDARILAAARAGLAAPAGLARKPPRWPLAVGIAASVALAVGLAWQLRPLPEAVVYDEAASAAVAPEEMQAEVAAAPAATAAPAEPAPAAGPEAPPAAFGRASEPGREAAVEQAPAADSQVDDAAPVSRQERYRAQPAPPPPAPAPARVLSQPSPVAEPDAGVADVVALPAPPAPPTPATQAAKTAAPVAPPATQAVTREAAARREQAAAESRSEAHAADAAAQETQNTQDTFADEPFVEDVPPATADSPRVRDAWLHRIRELHAAGETDAARASLEEFVRRYPDAPLPEDLQPLLD